MKEYKLDKTAFKIQTFEESDMENVYKPDVPYTERFRQSYFLLSIAYGFSRENPPRLDRTYFSRRKFAN